MAWLLRVMRAERASKETLRETLEQAVRFFESIAEEDRAEWAQALHFLLLLIYHRRPPDEHVELSQVVANSVTDQKRKQEVVTVIKTAAQVHLEEGRKAGLEQGRKVGREEVRKVGREEGRREMRIAAKQEDLLRALSLRCKVVPDEWGARVKSIQDVDKLNELFDRVVAAGSPEEIPLP